MLDFLCFWNHAFMHLHLVFMLYSRLLVFVCLFFNFCFVYYKKKKKKSEKYKKQCVFVYIGTCVPWMAIETKFLNFVSLVT